MSALLMFKNLTTYFILQYKIRDIHTHTLNLSFLFLLWVLCYIDYLCNTLPSSRWWQQCKPALDCALPALSAHMVGFGWRCSYPGQLGGLAALSCTTQCSILRLSHCKHHDIHNRDITSICTT